MFRSLHLRMKHVQGKPKKEAESKGKSRKPFSSKSKMKPEKRKKGFNKIRGLVRPSDPKVPDTRRNAKKVDPIGTPSKNPIAKPPRTMSVTAVLGRTKPRSFSVESSESASSLSSCESSAPTLVSKPLRTESTATATSVMSAGSPIAPFAMQTNQQAMMVGNGTNVHGTAVSVNPTQPHLVPDIMVLPSIPVHGQRMMVPAVWDANHRCFVVSVNARPALSVGYQFVYPSIQMSPPWMLPAAPTQMQVPRHQPASVPSLPSLSMPRQVMTSFDVPSPGSDLSESRWSNA